MTRRDVGCVRAAAAAFTTVSAKKNIMAEPYLKKKNHCCGINRDKVQVVFDGVITVADSSYE